MITTLAFLALAAAVQAPQQIPEEQRKVYAEYWERCVNVKDGDDLDRAIAACNELVNPAVPLDRPNRGLVHAKRGVLRTRFRLWPQALEDFNTALAWVAPDHRSWVLVERGLALQELRRYDEALVDLNAVISAERPSSDYYVRAVVGRGISYLLTRDYKRAAADFDWLIANQNTNAHILYMRSLARGMLGDPARAKTDMDEAVRLDPKIDATMKAYGVDLPAPPSAAAPRAPVTSATSAEMTALLYDVRLQVEAIRGQSASPQRTRDVEEGLALTAKALRMDGENVEALVYRSLFLRFKAAETASVAEQKALLAEAEALRTKADVLMKRK